MSINQKNNLNQSRETDLLVTGQGSYTDDIVLEDPLHVIFFRSSVATGLIRDIDISEASLQEGVFAVHIGSDVATLGKLTINQILPLTSEQSFPILANSEVFAVGQPIAGILAESVNFGLNATELIQLSLEESLDKNKSNIVANSAWNCGDPQSKFTSADVIVECEINFARLAPSSMEPRAIAIKYHSDSESITIWHSTQTPHRTRSELASILNINKERIRVIAPHVGGAFGLKSSIYPEEVFAVWAAINHRRNVKWTASRTEEFLSATHGRGIKSKGKLAATKEGNFIALSAEIYAPVGNWLPMSGLITAWNTARILPSGYKVSDVEIETQVCNENRAPTGIYRGAGRPESNCLMERLIEKVVHKLNLDPITIRAQNLLDSKEFPYQTVTQNLLDSGDYHRALEELCSLGGYDQAIENRKLNRSRGLLAGIGIAFYLEPSGKGWESARLTYESNGKVFVQSGSSTQGHGRESTYVKIVADALEVNIENIEVICGDTETCPEGIGAVASRSTSIGGSAVLEACQLLKKRIETGESLPISVDSVYQVEGEAFGYGCYLVEVTIDQDTGVTNINNATCVDDAGNIINPVQVEGQVRGGFAQGIGEALFEQIIYDEDGQLLSGSFMDYAIPKASDVPDLVIGKIETPSPMNILGAKGVGEAGTIGTPIAVLNAVIDALSPLGIEDIDMPLTPYKVWQTIQNAKKDK